MGLYAVFSYPLQSFFYFNKLLLTVKRHLLLALTAVGALFLPSAAKAQGEVFDTYTFTPEASKTVASISSIKITFPNGDYQLNANKANASAITLENDQQAYSCVSLSGFGSTWTMGFNSDASSLTSQQITDPGTYSLTIPAGVFYYQSSTNINSEIKATFTISDDIDFAWTVYPANGATCDLPSFGDIDISFTFTDASSVSTDPKTSGATPSVKLNGKALEQFADLSAGEGYRLTASGKALRLQVSKSLITSESLLTFQAPKGAFTIDGLASPTMTYMVTYQPPKVYTYEVSPASGSTVSALNEVLVIFNNANTAEKAMFLGNGDATLTNTETHSTVNSSAIDEVPGADHPTFKVSFAGELPDGKYTFKIDANQFELDGKSWISPEITASYTVLASYTGVGIVPPYLETFATPESFDGFTVIDANNDERAFTWVESEYNDGFAQEARVWELDGKDDWLISPALALEGGKTYKVSLHARAYGFWSETFEVLAGADNTVEAMTIPVISEIYLADGNEGEGDFFGYLTPAETGAYHIGIHATTATNGFYLHIDDLAVSAPLENGLPAAVSDFSISSDPASPLTATICFNAPSLTVDGANLESLTKIELLREGKLITTFENPAPGARLEYTDVLESFGNYEYIAVPYNTAGEGLSASLKTFIGVKKPSYPTNVHAVETENEGEVLITWDAPVIDADGEPIDPSFITYYIVELVEDSEGQLNQQLIKRYHSGTSLKYQAVKPGEEQQLKSFGVFAETDGGISNGSQTRLIAVGKPYALPFKETFDILSGNISLLSVSTLAGDGMWGIYDKHEGGVDAYDGDDAYAGMNGTIQDASAIMCTGKISLIDAVKPQASFYVYNFGADYANELSLMVDAGNDYEPVKTFSIGKLCGSEAGWYNVTVDLSAYAGHKIQLGFTATVKSYPLTFIDALEVRDASTSVSSALTGGASVRTSGGYILIANPAGEAVTVATTDGRIIYSGVVEETSIPASNGIYIVRIGKAALKVIVR